MSEPTARDVPSAPNQPVPAQPAQPLEGKSILAASTCVFAEASKNPEPADADATQSVRVSQLASPFAAPRLPASASTRPAADTPLPVIRGYEMLGVLGRGGMGVVYKARQVGLNRLVALKMISAGVHAQADELARFRLEAEAVANLQHPNIVQVHEIGEQDGRPYFSLELVEGGSLAQQLNGIPQPAVPAAQLAETLACAIHAAHGHGIIHRDLKPANVLLTPDGMPKITDFGLAKRQDVSSGQTQSGMILGTPSYMAPEQAQGKSHAIGPLADVYALGAILYELVTGRPPFSGETALDTLEQVCSQDPVLPSRLQPKIPPDLETICLKCLQKEPRRRYDSARALAEDLRRFLNQEPILARPIPLWERARKWTRRRPAAAALVGVGAATLLGLLLGSLWLNAAYARAAVEHQRAEAERVLREEREESERQRVAALQARGQELVRAGQEAYAHEQLPDAKEKLATARAMLHNEPSLRDLCTLADTLYDQTCCAMKDLEERQAARAKYAQFLRRKDDALSYGTLFLGVDLPANLEASQVAARQALEEFGITLETTAAPVLSDSYSAAEKTAITIGCYELLLIWAEAVAQPLPEQTYPERQRRAKQALGILDRAARLGLAPTHAYHVCRARYLAQLGDEADAQLEQERTKAVAPASAHDYFLIGDMAHKQGKLESAVNNFEKALWLSPEHFWAQYFLAVCCLKQQHWAEAKAHLTACLSRRPNFVWIYLLRGYAQGELRDFPAAEEDFRNAFQLLAQAGEDPLHTYVRYGVYVNRGALRIHQGKLEEAVADLKQAITLMPGQYQAYVNLAQVYQQRRQWDEAAAQLEQALRREPGLPALYRQRAQLALARKDTEAALGDFETAIRLKPPEGPDLAEDHLARGGILHQRQRYHEAVLACDAALKLRPDYAVVHRLRAEALLALQRYEEAVQAFDAYFRLEKAEPPADVYRGRGVARAMLNNYAGAVEDYTRALELEPDTAGMRIRRGWAYLNEATKLALRDFDKAIQLNPEDGDGYNGRGYARVKLGQYRPAVADADEALRRGPQTPTLFYNAACIYAQAVAKVQADAQESEREALANHYRARALELLRRTLAPLSDAEAARFWQQTIVADDALDPIRHSPGFHQMAAKYSRPAK